MKLSGGRWSPYVKRQLNRFLALYGHCGRLYRDGQYAVFDFDNTTAVFDVEHQLCIYQLMTMAFAMTPEQLTEVISLRAPQNDYSDWAADIGAAYSKLWESYGPFNGEMLPEEMRPVLWADPYWLEFAAKLRAMYGEVNRGEGALTGCLFPLFWFTGMTGDQVYRAAQSCYRYFSDRPSQYVSWTSPSSLPSRLGQVSYTWTSGVSVTDELKTLWRVLSENGIDVWVCSASGTVPVQAAIDFYGLRPYCTGMTGMNLKQDAEGRFLNEYDFAGGWYLKAEGDVWQRDDSALSALSQLAGKSTVIEQGLVRRYGCGPTAGFMDSAGDFFFCTEFASMKLALIFNRACFREGDPAVLLAQTALVQRKRRMTPLKAAESGDTLYLLQGRNENGPRSLRPGAASRQIGRRPRLFSAAESLRSLRAMKRSRALTAELIEARLPEAFKAEFAGYHSR